MGTNITIILAISIYKLASLLVGLAFSYMGFKLFMAGVLSNAGEINAGVGGSKFVLKGAAPGAFFALFGTIIVGSTISKGLEFNNVVECPAQYSSCTKASDSSEEKAQSKASGPVGMTAVGSEAPSYQDDSSGSDKTQE